MSSIEETKECPRCGARLFADMGVCYGCLYDFEKGPSCRTADPVRMRGWRGNDGETPGTTARVQEGESREPPTLDPDATIDFGSPGARRKGFAVRVVSRDLEVECPVFPTGMSVGRDRENDVVIPSRGVSRQHLVLKPTPEGVLVVNQGATNPATVEGRPIVGEELLRPGKTLDVCGTLLRVLAW